MCLLSVSGLMMYLFLAHDVFISSYDVFIFYGVYMLGGDTMFLLLLLFLVSHVLHWLLIYIIRLFMIYFFYFLFCEIKNLSFLFYLYFPHMSLCVC